MRVPGYEILAGLDRSEVRSGRAAALEPRGEPVDHQHPRSAVERGDRDGLPDRAGAEHQYALAAATRPRSTVRTAIDMAR